MSIISIRSMSAFSPIDDWKPRWASFAEFLNDDSGSAPDALFMVELDRCGGTRREWTRARWRQKVARTAAGLSARGVSFGDAVSVLAGNSADALAVAFACWVHGWTYVPLNAHEAEERQRFIVDHASASLLAHGHAETDRARAVAGSRIPAVRFGDLPIDAGVSVSSDGESSWDIPALRVYTSGTTGEPKGVELTAANLIADCDALCRASGWDRNTRALVALPIHHVNGLVVSCLQAWYVGGSVVLCDRFRSDTFWQDVESEGATTASLVPSILEFLLEQPSGRPGPNFREVYCGAGPLMAETALAFEERFEVPVRHLYGLSETTAVATMMPSTLTDQERRAWYTDHGFPSIGPALAHVEVEVHDTDGKSCAAGERGELVMRGATVMSGYAGLPEVTAQTMRDGWFHSGDLGFWRPSGDGSPFFFVAGRMKELIIRGGVNISPFQVDEVLNAHPAVRFGLAIPFENRYYGEEVAAYVVPSGDVAEQELLDFCAARLDFAYRPKVILFGKDVPFTSTGKAKRLALKDQLAKDLERYRNVQFRRHGPGSTPGD